MFLYKKISCYLLLLVAFLSCSKDKGFGPKADSIPSSPIIVQNATDYRPDPTVTTSIAGGGNFLIILSLPAGSKRTIKEITKVASNTSYTKIQSADLTGFYTSAPIAASNGTVTFSSSLTEYFTKNPVSKANPAAAANVELAFRFYFLVTLDDGSVIVTLPVRILVLA